MTDEISYARVKSDVGSAESYNRRRQDKHQQEMAMIARALALTTGIQSMLDAPCGVGRASIWLAQQGIRSTGIDLGEAALELARRLAADAGVVVQFEKQDIFALPYPDRHFDATLCFRLLHHFESNTLRSRLISEICRVSHQYVLISRISPFSVTSLRRRLRNWVSGKAIKQYPVTAAELDREFQRAGFKPVGRAGRFELFHSLQLQVYSRK
jgi:2-polyprenyl-3-methyl-5-hydroxy-6-metoxy-1,4-benzoquinol methylase